MIPVQNNVIHTSAGGDDNKGRQGPNTARRMTNPKQLAKCVGDPLWGTPEFGPVKTSSPLRTSTQGTPEFGPVKSTTVQGDFQLGGQR